MVFTVLALSPNIERSLIVERVKAGMRNARSKGRVHRQTPSADSVIADMRASIAEAYPAGQLACGSS